MLQGEHSAILSTFIRLSCVIKIFALSIIECLFYTCFAVNSFNLGQRFDQQDIFKPQLVSIFV